MVEGDGGLRHRERYAGVRSYLCGSYGDADRWSVGAPELCVAHEREFSGIAEDDFPVAGCGTDELIGCHCGGSERLLLGRGGFYALQGDDGRRADLRPAEVTSGVRRSIREASG